MGDYDGWNFDINDMDTDINEDTKKTKKTKKAPKPKPKPPQKEKIITVPAAAFRIPEFNDILGFCQRYMAEDIELKQFHRHAAPNIKRGGGGWAGVVKNTLAVLRKMKHRGEL